MSRWARVAASVAVLAAAAGCSIVAPACTDDLRYEVNPSQRTIAPGQAFIARVEFLGCMGTRELSDQVTYSSRDTTVAVVDARTGRVTGRGAGITVIEGRGAKYGLAPGIDVTVAAP